MDDSLWRTAVQGRTSAFDETFKGAPDCCTYEPPDTHAAVGTGVGAAGRVVEVTNSGVQIWDKTGAMVAGPTPLIAFLPTVPNTRPGTCPDAFDPKVLFDQHSGRFFIVVLEGRTPNPGGLSKVHIAVSTTNAPGNTGVAWTKMSGSALTLVGGFNTWFDYPSIGADNDSLRDPESLDAGGTFRGTKNASQSSTRPPLLAGAYVFTDIDVDCRHRHPRGVRDPARSRVRRHGQWELLLGEPRVRGRLPYVGDQRRPRRTGRRRQRAARVGGGGAGPCGGAQAGTAVVLDTLSSRAMNAVYRNGQVWTTLSSDMDGDTKTEVFWAKIATNGGLPAVPDVTDSGFLDGSDGMSQNFMPAVNTNAANDATIVYSQSFTDQFPEIRYASRAAGDPAGTFQASVVPPGGASLVPYNGHQHGAPRERWGDFARLTSSTPTTTRAYCGSLRRW